MADELKACPWCEYDGVRVTLPPEAYAVECPRCFCAGPQTDTEAEAITAWNTRTETQSQATIDELVGAIESASKLEQWIAERAAKIDHARYLESEGDTGKVNPEIDVLTNAQFDGMLASYRDEFATILSRHGGE